MPTKKKNNTILAIDPARRELGFCLLEEGDLLYYGVKSLERHNRLNSAKEHLLYFVKEFAPSLLAMEIKKPQRSMAEKLRQRIKSEAKALRLRACEYSASGTKRSISQKGRSTRRKVAEKLIERFPELIHFLSPRGSWKEKYRQPMFNAIALAITHYDKHQKYDSTTK